MLALLGVGADATGALAAPDIQRVPVAAGSVSDYWTAARLRAAEPAAAPAPLPGPGSRGAGDEATSAAPTYVQVAAPGEPAAAKLLDGSPARSKQGVLPGTTRDEIADPSAPDVSSHGKVFFTIPTGAEAGDYVCSGTAVNSKNRSVVWTAGHCVYPEGGGQFVTNWTFIPAYHEGSEPFGQWPAKRLATTGPWQEAANIKYDLGAAVVRRSGTGERLQTVVGACGIGFDQPRDQIYHAYGYPAVQPPLEFTGEREFRCTSRPTGADEPGTAGPPTMYIDCDMTGGSSGGGWIADGTLLSVTSYGYPLEVDHLYGPYMSRSAKALYRGVRKAKKKPSGPKGSHGPKGPKGGKGSKGGGKK